MSDKVIRWTAVDGECVTHHAMRVDDGGEQCIRCHALADVLHVGFLCGNCRDAELKTSESTSNGRAPTRNAMSEWIPASDRLPEFVDSLPNGERFSRPVLVAIEATDDVMIGTYGDQMGWMVGSDCMNTTITHWMPLPEPPEVK